MRVTYLLPPRGFKAVPGYNEIYVSKSGKVWSQKCGRYLAVCTTQYGHKIVGVYNRKNGRKGDYVHRLVAKAFHPNPTRKRNAYHKNGVPDDNKRGNLIWTTVKQSSKLTNRRNKRK